MSLLPKVNDSLLEFIPLYLPDLCILSLEGSSITNYGIFTLFSQADVDENYKGKESRAVSRLQSLNISECFQIDDVGLQEISHKAWELKELEIRGLNRITIMGLNYSLKGLKQLVKLDLRGLFRLRGLLEAQGLQELKVSIQILDVLQGLADLKKLEIYISGEIRGFGDLLGRLVIRNQELQELVLVKDYSLGMYSLKDLDINFDPSRFQHLAITLVTDESSRFG